MDLFFTNTAHASVRSIVGQIDKLIINPLIIFVFALALVIFLYGMFEFLSNQENEEKKTAGKKHMIFGVLGLTIMMAVWMILGMIMNTFNISGIDVKNRKVELPPYTPSYPSVR